MKKNFKLVLASVLALMMIVSMIPAMGDTVGQMAVNGALTVKGLDEGDKVTYYQILKWGPNQTPAVDGIFADAAGNYLLTNGTPTGWVWGNGVSAGVGTDPLTSADLVTIVGNREAGGVINSDMASKIASHLNNAVKSDMAVPANGTWTDTVTEPGLYMVIVTPKTPGTMYNPIFVAANFYSQAEGPDTSNSIEISENQLSYFDEGMAKKSTIPLSKVAIGQDNDNNYANLTNQTDPQAENTAYTADYHELIKYEVTTTVPKFAANYTKPVFKLSDTLDGLELVVDSTHTFLVQTDAATPVDLTLTTDYTVRGNTTGSKTFTVAFTDTYLKTTVGAAGQKIKVTYWAKVTDDCEKIVNQENNTVDLNFSVKPNDETGYGLLEDETNHFTFSIDADLLGHGDIHESSNEAIKIGVDKDGNAIVSSSYYEFSDSWHAPLEGAQFSLYTDEECTQKYSNDKFTGDVTSDAKGRLTIKGLDAGTYYLKEITAPTGYIKLQDVVKVVITADITENLEITKSYTVDGVEIETTHKTNQLNGYKVEFFKNNVLQNTTHYTIQLSGSTSIAASADRTPNPASSDQPLANTKGVELPSTGGIGTTIFYVGGSLMVLAAAILLITKRRMGVED